MHTDTRLELQPADRLAAMDVNLPRLDYRGRHRTTDDVSTRIIPAASLRVAVPVARPESARPNVLARLLGGAR